MVSGQSRIEEVGELYFPIPLPFLPFSPSFSSLAFTLLFPLELCPLNMAGSIGGVL